MRFTKIIYTIPILDRQLARLRKGTRPNNKQTEKTVSEEIEVIRPYKPVLAEAVKLRRSPDLNNIATYKAKFNYSLTDRKLELNSDIQKLQAQQVGS